MALTDDDRRHARIVLERGWLTIEQVTLCKEAVERTGLPFVEVARTKGWITPDRIQEMHQPSPTKRPKRLPVFYVAVLISAGLLVIGSDLYFRFRSHREDRRLEQTEMELRKQAEEEAQTRAEEVQSEQEKMKRQKAEKTLTQARALLLKVEEIHKRLPEEKIDDYLEEATQLYSLFLQVYPTQSNALVERARIHELHRAYPEAIQDLICACLADPTLEKDLRDRIQNLQSLIPQ